MWWLRLFEGWLVARLLSSPSFHRAVRRIHKSVQEMRHGKAPEDMGGTKIDGEKPKIKQFLQYFGEELRDQFRNKTTKK